MYITPHDIANLYIKIYTIHSLCITLQKLANSAHQLLLHLAVNEPLKFVHQIVDGVGEYPYNQHRYTPLKGNILGLNDCYHIRDRKDLQGCRSSA